MMDMTPGKLFHSSAFEPTDDELNAHQRAKRRWNTPPPRASSNFQGRGVLAGVQVKTRSPSPVNLAFSIPDVLSSDSDDDLPENPFQIRDTPAKKKVTAKKEEFDVRFCPLS